MILSQAGIFVNQKMLHPERVQNFERVLKLRVLARLKLPVQRRRWSPMCAIATRSPA
jgi:hypothetical protein